MFIDLPGCSDSHHRSRCTRWWHTQSRNHRKEKKYDVLSIKKTTTMVQKYSVKRRPQRNKDQNKTKKDTRQLLCFVICSRILDIYSRQKMPQTSRYNGRGKVQTSFPRKQRITLTEPLCHIEPLRASAVIVLHAGSHPITSIICGGTPKRASTCQRSVRSTESYAFCRSMKHRNSCTRAFFLNSCSIQTANIIPIVERCGRNPYFSSGSRFLASQSTLSLMATILRRTLPACATREIPR